MADFIHHDLACQPRWVLHKAKVPLQAWYPKWGARINDRATWAPLDKALTVLKAGDFDGLGFGLIGGDRMTFVDVDRCRNPATGELSALAHEILSRFRGTYAEPSTSGQGLHILTRGVLPPDTRNKREGGVEIYNRARFVFCHPEPRPLPGYEELSPCAMQESIDWLLRRCDALAKARASSRKKEEVSTGNGGDGGNGPYPTLRTPPRIIALIEHGDLENRYPSRSEAVFAAIRSMIKAGHFDSEIMAVMLNPANTLSQKPREQGRRWLQSEIYRAVQLPDR